MFKFLKTVIVQGVVSAIMPCLLGKKATHQFKTIRSWFSREEKEIRGGNDPNHFKIFFFTVHKEQGENKMAERKQ